MEGTLIRADSFAAYTIDASGDDDIPTNATTTYTYGPSGLPERIEHESDIDDIAGSLSNDDETFTYLCP